MRTRHYASTALLLLSSILALSCVTAQDEAVSEESPIRLGDQVFSSWAEALPALEAEFGTLPTLDPGMTTEEANKAHQQLGLYASMLDRQFDSLNAENEALRQELEQLRNLIADQDTPLEAGSDRDLQLIAEASPIYPPRAVAREFEGYVVLEYTVTARGRIEDISVIESNSSLFERPAIDAVKQYEYRPRTEDGVAVDVSGVRSRVVFELPD